MAFLNVGDHGWMIDGENETDQINEALNQQDLLAGKTLLLVQKVVRNYVNLGDDAALDGYQSCLGEIMRQASEAMQKGVKMEISDNERNDIN